MDQSIHETVAAAVADLGLPAPASFIQTMLLKDGYFVGWKLRYDGGHALLHSSGNTLELFDDEGTLMKTTVLNAEQKVA